MNNAEREQANDWRLHLLPVSLLTMVGVPCLSCSWTCTGYDTKVRQEFKCGPQMLFSTSTKWQVLNMTSTTPMFHFWGLYYFWYSSKFKASTEILLLLHLICSADASSKKLKGKNNTLIQQLSYWTEYLCGSTDGVQTPVGMWLRKWDFRSLHSQHSHQC